jgi:putative flippase GtrA
VTLPPFLLFAIAGAMGFGVDLAMLWLGLNVLGLDEYTARLVSFAVTVTFTWAVNRHLTFGDRRARDASGMLREWVRFVTVNSGGLMINYAVYAALVTFAGGWLAVPYVAAGCGSAAGLVVNYFASSRLVFRSTPPAP